MKKRKWMAGFLALELLTASVIPSGQVLAGEVHIPERGTVSVTDSLKLADADADGFVIENGVLTGYTGEGGAVEIPEGVTKIGDYAFEKCTSLKSVSIPESVTDIGCDVFADCTSLSNVEILGSVKSIESGMFQNCKSLKNMRIPEGVTGIGDDAFHGCTGLESMIVPKSVTDIGYGAFGGCTSLSNVEILGSVKRIEDVTFWNCKSLKNMRIPEGVTGIGEIAFSYCTSLESVSIPGSVTGIGPEAFSYCTSLESVSIPGSVQSIESDAFFGCKSLKNVKIADGVTDIEGRAFKKCGLESVSIPGSVKVIRHHMFEECKSLKSVSIAEGVTGIENGAFTNCINLKSVTIPKSVKSIEGGANTFYACRNVTIYCVKDSYAETYAKENNLGYSYINGGESTGKKKQTITAKSLTRTYGDKAFSLGAKTDGGGRLTYQVADKNIAVVSSKGKVTIKGCGRTKITISAAAKGEYKKATKTITLTVKPRSAQIVSAKSGKSGTVTVKWKQDKKAKGYLVEYSTDRNFKGAGVKTISKNKMTSVTIPKLEKGKKYYVRVCAYAQADRQKIKGTYSKVKTVRVKK